MKQKLHKKGQGLPMNIIIIGAIGLVVLVIVITIAARWIVGSGQAIGSCTEKGGVCVQKGECDLPYVGLECDKEGEVCCHPT